MELTRKEIAFCDEYVKDYNGTQAAVRAGYKKSNAASQASRLLKKSEILEKIQINQKEIVKNSCLTEEKVINHLQEILSQCMAAVPVMKWDYNLHEMVETGRWQFDAKGALEAVKLLGKHLGMFNDRNDNNDEYQNDGFIEALKTKVGELKWEE